MTKLSQTMYVASSRDDSVTALDIGSGETRWQFFAEGPIRFAPVAWQDRVAFGSDDGCVYCLDADTGKTEWKFRAVGQGYSGGLQAMCHQYGVDI